MRSRCKLRLWAVAISLCACLVRPLVAQGDPQRSDLSAGTEVVGATTLYVEVCLTKQTKVSDLKAGDILEGSVVRDVYAGGRDAFPTGSTVHLVVSNLEKRKREPTDHWPGVIGLFAPRHQTVPVFSSATVSAAGRDVPLQVSLISIMRPVEVRAHEAAKSAKGVKEGRGQTLILEAAAPKSVLVFESREAAGSLTAPPITLAAGTQAQIVLLSPLSASKSRAGDSFRALLIEPVLSGSRIVLPAGSIFEGEVVVRKPPRWLSRPGTLHLAFTRVTQPGGSLLPVAAQVTGIEADERSHLCLNNEGTLSGAQLGKAWMLINLGVTAGVAKETDDAAQLVIEALVSTATDASTAGTARIVGACGSAFFMVTRHGRDVVLPKFTELELTFSRPLGSRTEQKLGKTAGP